MRETDAPSLPSLYDALVGALDTEDTDPFGVLPFTQQLVLPPKPPAPRKPRTHREYQTARFREWWYRGREKPVSLQLEVGAWVPDRLLDDEDTVVVDINMVVASDRLRR